MKTRRKLKGDHNQCPACGEYFNSTHAFDKHRIGAYGKDRRCMTIEEMTAAGMGKRFDRAGLDWWVKKDPSGFKHANPSRLVNATSSPDGPVNPIPYTSPAD